jgi:hypothetical protein
MDDHVLFLIVLVSVRCFFFSLISWLNFFWDFGEAWALVVVEGG